MASSIKLKEMEIFKLKEDNKKLTKRFIQKKADDHDQAPFSSLKVKNYTITVNDEVHTWKKTSII